jgi:hypothetical protein
LTRKAVLFYKGREEEKQDQDGNEGYSKKKHRYHHSNISNPKYPNIKSINRK